MSKFKVGDRVVGVCKAFDWDIKDVAGTVRSIDCESIGVEFDKNIGGHDGFSYGMSCKDGHGVYVLPRQIKRINHPTIVITTDGKTTTATLREGKSIIKAVTATCHPDDDFSLATGATLALNRLMYGTDYNPAEVAFEDEKPRYYNGKVICVDNHGSTPYTVGKIYSFCDGKTVDDSGSKRPTVGNSTSFGDFVLNTGASFIEYKGGLE